MIVAPEARKGVFRDVLLFFPTVRGMVRSMVGDGESLPGVKRGRPRKVQEGSVRLIKPDVVSPEYFEMPKRGELRGMLRESSIWVALNFVNGELTADQAPNGLAWFLLVLCREDPRARMHLGKMIVERGLPKAQDEPEKHDIEGAVQADLALLEKIGLKIDGGPGYPNAKAGYG